MLPLCFDIWTLYLGKTRISHEEEANGRPTSSVGLLHTSTLGIITVNTLHTQPSLVDPSTLVSHSLRGSEHSTGDGYIFTSSVLDTAGSEHSTGDGYIFTSSVLDTADHPYTTVLPSSIDHENLYVSSSVASVILPSNTYDVLKLSTLTDIFTEATPQLDSPTLSPSTFWPSVGIGTPTSSLTPSIVWTDGITQTFIWDSISATQSLEWQSTLTMNTAVPTDTTTPITLPGE